MSKAETNFYNRVHKHISPNLYHMKNNNPYLGGIPDVWYSGKGGDAWVEYKYLDKLPVRGTTKININLSALQTQWLNDRRAEGRSVFVVVGVAGGGVIMRNGEWNEEWTCERFKLQVLSTTAVASAINATLL